jgi:hypothetical protein
MRGILFAILAATILTSSAFAEVKGIGPRSTFAQIELAVRHAVPLGSDASAAKAYLNQNDVEYSDVDRERQIYAIIRDIKGGSFLVSKAASIRIRYDSLGRVTDVDVSPTFTGP